MTTPAIGPDLELIGFQLVASAEVCRCAVCSVLDMRYDVDAVAVRPDGLPVFVAYRAQLVYDYQTITVRWANDRGNEEQLANCSTIAAERTSMCRVTPPVLPMPRPQTSVLASTSGRTKVCPGTGHG